MPSDPVRPAIPPIATSDLPGVGGAIGPAEEDFVVDELPLYAASGEGEHLYVRIQKRGLTTRDAVRALADAANVPVNEVGTAGMKDKHAVTTQWVSLPARRAGARESWKELPESLSIVETSRHGNKLRTGHLAGNRFRIRITGITGDSLARATAILDRIRERGVPNYFGAQRFGRDGEGLSTALEWLRGEAGVGPRRRAQAFERKLYTSVVQAEVFNRYLTARIARGLSEPLPGEVVRLEGSGSLFVVEDTAREMPRWAARDIHPTGPVAGPKMRAAREEPLAMEEEALAALGLDERMRTALGRHGDGTRRDLLLWPKEMTVEESGTDALTVQLVLPSGSYATVLVRELTRETFFRGDQPDARPGPEVAPVALPTE
ncbi:MAG TPA: tRNA pseudouridine(13) synthase TruD [Polyangiaceae bacterium]